MDFLSISSYGEDSEGVVRITKDLEENVAGKDVLVIEDIVDTGFTLKYLIRTLGGRNPKSVEVCALLDRRARRIIEIDLKYMGFEIPDKFVVGYGLDYRQRYRNLRYIGVVKPSSRRLPYAAKRRQNLAQGARACCPKPRSGVRA